MAPSLDDAWAKVEWAYRQLVAVDRLLEPFTNGQPYLIRDEINPEGTERIVTAEYAQPVPSDLSLVFGDFIHALHSALDYVVCSAVEISGETVTTSHAFPIFLTRTAYEGRSEKMLAHVPDQLIDLIEGLQPYHETERAISQGLTSEEATVRTEYMPLMRLYRLSIEEKHRALLLATAIFSSVGMYVGHDRTDEKGSGIGFSFSASYDKAVVTFPLDPSKPDERFDPHFAAKVTLVKEGPHGMPVESIARMLYREVAHHVLPKVRLLGVLPLTSPRDLPFVF